MCTYMFDHLCLSSAQVRKGRGCTSHSGTPAWYGAYEYMRVYVWYGRFRSTGMQHCDNKCAVLNTEQDCSALASGSDGQRTVGLLGVGLLVLLGPETGRHHSFQNVGYHNSPGDTASHLKRPDSSATPLQEPQISFLVVYIEMFYLTPSYFLMC